MPDKKEYTIEEKLKFPIPYKWKIQSFAKYVDPKDKSKYLSQKMGGVPTSASCVAYIDARDVMDLLDRAVGFENWTDRYYEINGQVMCSLGLRMAKNEEFVYKSDTGSAGDIEAEKSVVSDAFKRAAVKWGIGRFLYDLEIKWVDINEFKQPIDPNKNRIWNLSEYFKPKK